METSTYTNPIRVTTGDYTSLYQDARSDDVTYRDDRLAVKVSQWTYGEGAFGGPRQRLDVGVYPEADQEVLVYSFENPKDVKPFVSITVGEATLYVSKDQAAAIRDQLNERL